MNNSFIPVLLVWLVLVFTGHVYLDTLCNLPVEYCFPLGHCLLFGTRWHLKHRIALALVSNLNAACPEWVKSQRMHHSSVRRMVRCSCLGDLWNIPLTVWCCGTVTVIWHLLWLSYRAEFARSGMVVSPPHLLLCLSLAIFLPSGTTNASNELREEEFSWEGTRNYREADYPPQSHNFQHGNHELKGTILCTWCQEDSEEKYLWYFSTEFFLFRKNSQTVFFLCSHTRKIKKELSDQMFGGEEFPLPVCSVTCQLDILQFNSDATYLEIRV